MHAVKTKRIMVGTSVSWPGATTPRGLTARRGLTACIGLTACLGLTACGASGPDEAQRRAVGTTYADLLYAGYDDAVMDARDLRAALEPLIRGEPTESDLSAARQAWTDSRRHYMQTEYGRFQDGPIDGPLLVNPEARINSWPLDEATIDYVRASADGEPMMVGIVNTESDGAITATLLDQRNQMPGEANVTTGYHAIEFLLWGQDFRTDGPGDRPVTDFISDGSDTSVTRRREYLGVVADLLVRELSAVRDEWAPSGTYRSTFLAMPSDVMLSSVLTGWAKLTIGELSGQRMNEALVTRDQEDEHSCFSDTTLLDHLDDARSLQNLYLGRYARRDGTMVSGTSLSDLVAAEDPALDARVRADLMTAIAGVEALPRTPGCAEPALESACPFDQLLRNDAGRGAVMKAVSDVRAVGRDIAEIASLLGVMIDASE